MKTCPNCNRNYTGDERFCPRCGSKLVTPKASPSPTQKGEPRISLNAKKGLAEIDKEIAKNKKELDEIAAIVKAKYRYDIPGKAEIYSLRLAPNIQRQPGLARKEAKELTEYYRGSRNKYIASLIGPKQHLFQSALKRNKEQISISGAYEEGLVNEVLKKLNDLLDSYSQAKRDMGPKTNEEIEAEMEYIRQSLPKLEKIHHHQHYWLVYLYELGKCMTREDEALYFILLLGGPLAKEGHTYKRKPLYIG